MCTLLSIAAWVYRKKLSRVCLHTNHHMISVFLPTLIWIHALLGWETGYFLLWPIMVPYFTQWFTVNINGCILVDCHIDVYPRRDAENPERSGMGRNETGSNCCAIRTWTLDMLRKIGVNMPGLSMYKKLISHLVPATKTGQAPSRQYRATPTIWNILAVYLESSSGIADPLLTSEG